MRFTALFAMSSCAGLFLTEQCKPASEPAKQDFRQGAVEIAPHPRDRFTHTVSRGFVTSIEKTHIKVQGFDFHIKDSNHMEIIAVGRTLAEVKTGPALTISGSFP